MGSAWKCSSSEGGIAPPPCFVQRVNVLKCLPISSILHFDHHTTLQYIPYNDIGEREREKVRETPPFMFMCVPMC